MMPTDDELLADEIQAHQFTEPLKAPARPPSLARRAVVRATTGRVWFRVGWTCGCVVQVLETAEKEMLLRGLIADSLDIYQLQGNASASAGTHALPGAYDVGQDSPDQIDVQRLCGGDGQARTTAQGFAVKHCHGFAQGCPHGSPGLLAQKRQWNNRQNGLVSHGPIQGRWPTKPWATAVSSRKAHIMALADDIATKVAAKIKIPAPVRPPTPPTPAQIWGYSATGPDGKTKWTLAHIVSWAARILPTVTEKLTALAIKSDAQDKKIDALAATVAAIKTKTGA